MSFPIHLLIADDHLIIRQGLRLILETEDDFAVVGEASDGAEAVKLAGELKPDVILMDLRMPGMDGLAAIEKLSTDLPEIAIVILTTFDEDDLMLRGLRLGAKGFLLKDTGRETLFSAIRAAARGEMLFKPDVLARLLSRVEDGKESEMGGALGLTAREREVLAAVAQGKRSKEIAFKLNITERTVKSHLASIYNKFGVDSRAAAIAVAAQRGLL